MCRVPSHDYSQCFETLKTKSLFATCPTWQFWLPCNFLLFFKFWNSEALHSGCKISLGQRSGQNRFFKELSKHSRAAWKRPQVHKEITLKSTVGRFRSGMLLLVSAFWIHVVYMSQWQRITTSPTNHLTFFFKNPGDVNFRKYVTVWLPQHQSEDPDRRH